MYTVNLQSHGNPDLAQYTSVSEPEAIQVSRLETLIADSDAYIRRWNLGAGNWPFPVVYKDGEPVGRLAYNLRLVEA